MPSGRVKTGLDKEILAKLLQKADNLWFQNHRGPFSYQEHVYFTADYLANHYHDKRGSSDGHYGLIATGKNLQPRQDSQSGKKSKKEPHLL